ncbi:MAG: hypothetical protein AB1401_00855 [Thermodesulfobacteriota bacterium]
MANDELKIGDEVKVPYVLGNISALCRSGILVGLMEPYAKVFIRYGSRQTGYWIGKIAEVRKIHRK